MKRLPVYLGPSSCLAFVWRRASAAVALTVLAWSSPAATAQQADSACGNPFVNAVGPLDYLVVQNRKIVEDYHFTPQVESLVSGQTGTLGGDIDYTLRAFPNHHRALVAMMNLGAKLKTPQPPGAHFTVECYFKRALLFRPEDIVARMIYGKYLASNKRNQEANAQLEYATSRSEQEPFAQYNAGLIYFEMGEFDRALMQAHKAYALGFQRQELKQKLEAVGKWADAPSDRAAPTGSSASSAAPTAQAASQSLN